MPIEDEIRDAAWRWFEELRSYWRNGVQPNMCGLEYLRGELSHFNAQFGVVQGDGRNGNGRFSFDWQFDFKILPTPRIRPVLEAAARGDSGALLRLALVIYPCDTTQFHQGRGRTLIPYQLAFAEAGHRLVKRGDGAYLPDGIDIGMIPDLRRPPLRLF